MKSTFWKNDWFLGLLIVLVFLLLARSGLMQNLERKAYDLGMQVSSRLPSDKIAVIAIDGQSIARLGHWPWSRNIDAQMITLLSDARAIGYTVPFVEPQTDPGLTYIERLLRLQAASALKTAADPLVQAESARVDALLHEAEGKLNPDRALAESVEKSNNVLLAMFPERGPAQEKPDTPLPAYIQKNLLAGGGAGFSAVNSVSAVIPPIPAVGSHALAIGFLDTGGDSEPLVLRYGDKFLPSLSLMLAARSLNLEPRDIKIKPGGGIGLGKLNIATDPALQMRTFFYNDRDGRPAFPVDSFFDVYSGKIPAGKYRDKVVLVGVTAGVSAAQAVSPSMVLILAHSLSSILREDFYIIPPWASWAEMCVFMLIAFYLALLLPRLKTGTGIWVSSALLILLVATHFVLMLSLSVWLKLVLPATLLLTGHLMLIAKRRLLSAQARAEAESSRMLGLAFQAQGQLDIAFEKFRQCPLDDMMMDVLYKLGLDFEHRQQFNKAESVFSYMTGYNPTFRDLQQKLMISTQMSETVMLGGGSAALISEEAPAEKSMLGRYQIEQELGKGSMGVVYLGKDPRIGRVVAIKTMALAEEFDEDELADVKERFFREAETAGRLNHPNIVTIYDAGEERDLAYIAMEFLKGRDLTPYVKPDNLLPPPAVFSIIARVADALDYAHTQHVVHRDIKPANIMYEAGSDSLKVTDFGIARITDSSKTKTGMILGTPSYMSPEQLTGKKIDGRSDLFSLGVTFYQLLTAQLPFLGASMAQLMFRIANEPHPKIRSINASLPPCASAIIDKALQKLPEQRYQSGADFARAVRACAAHAARGA